MNPRAQQRQEKLLAQISYGAELCAQAERRLAAHPAPELETLIKVYRVLILKLSLEANVAPKMLKLVSTLMKPVMDWAQLEEKRKEREFAQQKHREQLATDQENKRENAGKDGLTPETLEKIERELKLF